MSIPTIAVAGRQVGRIGYGLMQLTWTAAPPTEEDLSQPSKLPPTPVQLYPEYKEKIVLVVKGAADPVARQPKIGDIDFLRKDIADIQSILGDKPIDVYLPARLDPNTPIEKAIGNLVTLQKEGLFSAFGVSEVTAETAEKAHKVAPLSIVENEVSLFHQDEATRKIVEWSKTNKVPIFAYAPLGRGFLAGRFKKPEDIPEGFVMNNFPWFQPEAFETNAKLAEKLEEIAKSKGLTASQLALAWLTQKSEYIIPIPGSSKPDRVQSNTEAANIKFTPEELAEIDKYAEAVKVAGDRYPAPAQKYLMQ
ncbi:hypothetical protein CI109_106743 [Kwoniella shandongensis]|uniref:NADP-dependent oxidoreductase domain-containing protein n=1 Tax=Kwoniella shandongensis TaxID=1734106 RepID=A0AAJ8LQM4_9TREE